MHTAHIWRTAILLLKYYKSFKKQKKCVSLLLQLLFKTFCVHMIFNELHWKCWYQQKYQHSINSLTVRYNSEHNNCHRTTAISIKEWK